MNNNINKTGSGEGCLFCPCEFDRPSDDGQVLSSLAEIKQRLGLDGANMTYDEALGYIHGRLRFGIKEGLARIEGLCRLLGNPQDNLKVIHVAGTNGKGSVCAMISRVLSTARHSTGLFISPYITDFCERMQIDGHPVSHGVLAALTSVVRAAADELERKEGEYATEFEIVTAIAFLWFALAKCDYVVLETGLGGRLDSTNVVKSPLCSVIMAIDFDHTDILGDTLTKIAFEKCGIIKEGRPVVVFPKQQDEALKEIKRQCSVKNSELIIPDLDEFAPLGCDFSGTRFMYKDEIYNLSLLGEHQALNAITAVEALKALEKQGVTVGQNNIEHGLLRTTFPCRREIVSQKPLVIIDGAHNPNASQVLKNAVGRLLSGKRVFGVAGMLRDKDFEKNLEIISPMLHSIFTVPVDNPRSLSARELAVCAQKYCNAVAAFDEVRQAIEAALAQMSDGDALLIFGSLYLASEVNSFIRDML